MWGRGVCQGAAPVTGGRLAHIVEGESDELGGVPVMQATHFFLGANSGRGFQSLFDRFCVPEDHHDLLVLKGGPGVGKSTMMRRIGAAMEERGEEVEYLYCSGDPASLDGVHIPRIRTAVVDGTAPHVVEPQYPAAVDRYVNLGQFYDIAAAKAARGEIVAHTRSVSAAYQRAYHALGAARQMDDSAAALVLEGLDAGRLLHRTDGIIGREIRGKGTGGPDRLRFLGSLTCRGPVWRFDTAAALCPRIYQLQDTYGLAAPMLERLHAAARSRGYAAVVCPDPEHMAYSFLRYSLSLLFLISYCPLSHVIHFYMLFFLSPFRKFLLYVIVQIIIPFSLALRFQILL